MDAACEYCGGTEFYKRDGGFFCGECNTQSQRVETAFADTGPNLPQKSGKNIKKADHKIDQKLTSWECHNYILRGLVQELMDLGAKSELVVVVHYLWMKYLHKCEVFDIENDQPPKLSVLAGKKDIDILLDRKKKKRHRSRSTNTSLLDSKRRYGKTKSALAQSNVSTQDTSVAYEDISNIESDASTSSKMLKLEFSRASRAELKRIMSKKHRRAHIRDVDGLLTCHKFRQKEFSASFVSGPNNLTYCTLYSILYIGLLITGDAIQLGDMLRFIREGHLSFGCYRHFLDEDISETILNLPHRNERVFSNILFRQKTAKMAQFLQVTKYIKTPNFVDLCERYCLELNLPNAVFECCKNLIWKTKPKMVFHKTTNVVPNYEARAISFVVFSLKLLFGLDGVTESKIAEQAKALNGARSVGARMFHFVNWLEFVTYRNAVVKNHHFPTAVKNGENVDSDLYLSYIKSQRFKFKGNGRRLQRETNDYVNLLEKLAENADDDPDIQNEDIVFEPSLTPFQGYVSTILNHHQVRCKDVLMRNFTDDSLQFLFEPSGRKTRRVKHGGANDDIVLENPLYANDSRQMSQKTPKLVPVKITDGLVDDKYLEDYLEQQKMPSIQPTQPEVLLFNWEKGNRKNFERNERLLQKTKDPTFINEQEDEGKPLVFEDHYNAFERYWLNIPANPLRIVHKPLLDEIVGKFPHSFRLVLNECARIIELDASDFFWEFLACELYLVYCAQYNSKKSGNKEPTNLKMCLKSCKDHW